uniref:INO80 complex subunit B-like conserved region domain-containing protein n=1 Tax=Araucaria cunninghamii TaxID=56994 RepID=A0A0D6QZU2_ARACU
MENGGEGSYLEGARRPRSLSTRRPRPRSESHTFPHNNKTGSNSSSLSSSNLQHKAGSHHHNLPASSSRAPEGSKRRHRLILPENSDDEDDFPPKMEKPSQVSTKHLPTIKIPVVTMHSDSKSKEDNRSKFADEGIVMRRTETSNDNPSLQPLRKSTRVPKKYVPDDEYDEAEEDEEGLQPRRKRKSKSEKGLEELYQEDDDKAPPSSDEDSENSESEIEDVKRRKGDTTTSLSENKKEVPLTARQKAVQMSKTVDPEVGQSLIEFPEGLPPTSQRKRQEKLPDFELQLKKADAARRRRMQAEKAAQEIQADTIKRILGQDSYKQKREEKLRRQRDEMEQEKRAAANTIGSNSVRWVIGPSGTVVSFSEDAEFLGIFNSVPSRYPPAREKCAGPSCNNTYKYRDSKSNLPLCSLLCYRAVHDMAQPLPSH